MSSSASATRSSRRGATRASASTPTGNTSAPNPRFARWWLCSAGDAVLSWRCFAQLEMMCSRVPRARPRACATAPSSCPMGYSWDQTHVEVPSRTLQSCGVTSRMRLGCGRSSRRCGFRLSRPHRISAAMSSSTDRARRLTSTTAYAHAHLSDPWRSAPVPLNGQRLPLQTSSTASACRFRRDAQRPAPAPLPAVPLKGRAFESRV